MAENQEAVKAGVGKKSFVGGLKENLYSFGIVLSLVLLCIILTILSPRFLTVDNLMNVASQASVNAIVSIGLFLAILTSGIDLSVGSILALSTMGMGILAVKLGLNPIFSLFMCLLFGTLLGYINGLMLTKLRLPHPFISTMGMKQMARGIALAITAAQPISGFHPSIDFLGSNRVGPVPVSLFLVAFLYIVMYLFLTRTATGRYIYAVGGNKEASRLSGINVNGILNLVFTISGFMAALAGIVLVGRVDSAYPLAGMDYESDAIAAVIIGGASFFGGIGKIGNTIVGVLIIAVLRNGLNLLNVNSALQTFTIGAVIIVAVFVDVLRQRVMKAR
ncbi:ribose transport system permease protein RbsC [Treponema primitia ZAS-2]|uniref:Ribose transport system permease protein RbsC n=1 Tax=Treponema primitia (strain ATCC BAA-887 / DSM 12427 / ZAS-2) TaxID=545694 RepID=F5YM99_TREPZ|nr:ABC transporter permease [Treponema primitia]AEF85328.1 ribose transport system permease protein RbsC [Treponema primitia ZAS-2]